MMARAESRTEHGWQRFDRVVFMVTLLLVLALLVVWFTGVTAPNAGDAGAPLTTATTGDPVGGSSDTAQAASADKPDKAADDAGSSELAVKLPTARSAQVEQTPPADGATDTSKNAATDSSPDDADPIAQALAQRNSPSDQGDADAARDGRGADDENKSLASQDPAKQATFERIPKYLERPIAASGTSPSTGDDATTGARVNGLPAVPVATAGGPKVKPILELRSAAGALSVEGIVSDEMVRAEILQAALKTYGMRNLSDKLEVNPAVETFAWEGDPADLMVLMGGPDNTTTLRIDGTTITLTGEVAALADKQARALAAQQLFGTTARIDNRLRVVAPAPSEATGTPKDGTADSANANVASDRAGQTDTADSAPGSASAAGKTNDRPAASAEPASTTKPDPALAEGGPGQTDSVTLQPTALPDRIARGECPRIATGVLLPFGSASIELSDAVRSALDRLKPCFMRRDYVVGAHTDSRGSATNNKVLSQARAQAVVDYLVSIGVPKSRLTATGYGESTPIISNRSDRGRARNRRVDFRFRR